MRRGDVVFPAPSLPSRRRAGGWMADGKKGEEEGGFATQSTFGFPLSSSSSLFQVETGVEAGGELK